MKKLITTLGVIALAACHSSGPGATMTPAPTPVTTTGAQTGAADPISAVRGFMTAAKQQDLQAMGAIWGDANGPARDAINRDELEKRELIMITCLKHDSYDIVGDAPSTGGGRAIAVNLRLGPVAHSTSFQVVRGPANRWYVQKFDLESLEQICAQRG